MIDIKSYLNLEMKIKGLDEDKVYGIPIWRLVKTQFRWDVRKSRPFTVSPKIEPLSIINNYFKSLWSLTKVLLFGSRKKFLFFPHPRLFFVDEKYLDRLSDPLIDFSGITDYLILERNQNGVHKRPRYHNERIIYLDFIDINARLFSILLSGLIHLKYHKQIDSLYSKLNNTLTINSSRYKALFASKITQFILSRWMVAPVLRKLNPEVVFFAPRGTYDYAETYCKKMGAISVELQHGIVLSESDLYTTQCYNREYDPDYFFVFGSSNIGKQYGIPVERVLNIGFPYKNYIRNLPQKQYASNITLVASEPEITDKIVESLIDIVCKYSQYEFHIRLHPQEVFSKKNYERIIHYPQIKVVDNRIESFCAISQYKNVMGEQSSVLFEAMSLNKKVARLNYCGLKSTNTAMLHGGTLINSADDFHKFMISSYETKWDSDDIYSDFQSETLKNLVK